MDDNYEEEMTLSARKERILHDQAISDTEPGPIVHDFRAMLCYVQANDLTLSNGGLLPIKSLRPLNEMMHRPLEVGLRRPFLQSFPNLEGLYLILRASGLVRVEYKGRKRLLKTDAAAFALWEQLNDVEQYVHLLRVWLLWADPDVTGRRTFLTGPMLPECLYSMITLPQLLKRNPEWAKEALFSPSNCFKAALAELFGLIATDQQPAQKGEGWTVTSVKITPYGEALSALLVRFLDDMAKLAANGGEPRGFEVWRDCLQPFFPNLHREFLCPQTEPVEGIHVVTVSVDEATCQFAVPHSCLLDTLADAILDAFEFDHDHLYEFIAEDQFGSSQHINHSAMEEPPCANDTTIGELCLQPGQHMRFCYDFAEDWQFDIAIDRIDPPDRRMRRPKLLNAQGEPPLQYEWEIDDYDDPGPEGGQIV